MTFHWQLMTFHWQLRLRYAGSSSKLDWCFSIDIPVTTTKGDTASRKHTSKIYARACTWSDNQGLTASVWYKNKWRHTHRPVSNASGALEKSNDDIALDLFRAEYTRPSSGPGLTEICSEVHQRQVNHSGSSAYRQTSYPWEHKPRTVDWEEIQKVSTRERVSR